MGRFFKLVFGLLCVGILVQFAPQTTHAYPVLYWGQGTPHVVGMVEGMTGTQASPQTVTLSLGLQMVTVKIVPQTVISAHTAEADIEGFSIGDYASVTVRGPARAYVAKRITYDVHLFAPLRSFSGVIERVWPNGKRFSLRMPSGNMFQFRVLTKLTAFKQDGKIADPQPTLSHGELIQVLGLHSYNGWSAAEVTLRATTGTGTRSQFS